MLKQGNSVYSSAKWVCFLKNGVMVLNIFVQKPGYSVLAIEKNCNHEGNAYKGLLNIITWEQMKFSWLF